jgi:Cdc6-like AAA superfamily ATPase
MKTYINVKVEQDHVTTIKINKNPRQAWLDFIDAVSNNPRVELVFVQNDMATFYFFVNEIKSAEHTFHINQQPDLFAAYQSNPIFEIIEKDE